MDFQAQKKERLQHVDLSRKGSVDEFILDTVNRLNSISCYFTTSSCSGRIIIFETCYQNSPSLSASEPAQQKITKKDCKWLLVSHDRVSKDSVEEALSSVTDEAVLKFEPMIMHIQCQSLQDAQHLHHAAVAAGFRNSGISIGNKGKIIVAVRSTHGLEVPLSSNGNILISKEYLSFLTDCANQKMDENFTRISRFFEGVKLLAEKPVGSSNHSSSRKSHEKPSDKSVVIERKKENLKRKDECHKKEEDYFSDGDLSLLMFENT